jgi:S-formylglutathione hydrolase FrmB
VALDAGTRAVITQLTSQHLAHNVYGDPITRDLVVYLPPSYEGGTKRYPTVYLLHGFRSTALGWIASFRSQYPFLNVLEVLDDAVKRGQSREMIVVMPDGMSRLGCSQWIDSPVNGDFEQYVVRDVVAHVDATLRTIPAAEARGVTGSSSGGFGAWHLASRHPDVFSAMSVLSADAYFEHTHKPWIYNYYDQLGGKEPNGPINGEQFSWLTYGLASCYSPNPAKPPFYVDLPVSYPTGELIPEIWQKWLDYDPIVSYRSRMPELKRLKGILLDVGVRDEWDYHYAHRILSKRLTEAGIDHRADEHGGGHGDHLYERLQITMEWFSGVLTAS